MNRAAGDLASCRITTSAVAGRPVFLAAQFTPQIFVAIVFMKTLMAAMTRHFIAKD